MLMIMQIEFVKDKTTKEPFDPKLGLALAIHEKGKGILRVSFLQRS
jgi:hypothetical protein